VAAVRIAGPVNTYATQLLINDTLVSTARGNRVSEQDVRDDLIAAINNASARLGVTATRGRTEYELLVTANRPGTPFSLAIPQQNQTATLIPEEISANHLATPQVLTDGSLVVNGKPIRATRAEDDTVSSEAALTSKRAASAVAIAAAINDSVNETGITAQATPAVIEGVAVDTTTMATGDYTLFLNGVAVTVPITQGESAAARRLAVTGAINKSFGKHGVEAIDNGLGITLATRDGRNLSAWFDRSVVGLSAATFGLDAGDGGIQVTTITLRNTPVVNPTRNLPSDRLSVTYSNYGRPTESLLVTPFNTDNAQPGLLQIDAQGDLYKVLDGNRRVFLADRNLSALNGASLGFSVEPFLRNTGFFGYNGQTTDFGNWRTINSSAALDGVSTISLANRSVTQAVPYPNLGPGSGSAQGGTFGSQIITSSPNNQYANGAMALQSANVLVTTPGDTAWGPTLISGPRIPMAAGDSVSFDFRATPGQDTYALYAYLIDPDRPAEPILITNQSGNTPTDGVPTLTRVSKTLGPNESGCYFLVIVGGSRDSDGDGLAGATIQIDNVANTTATNSAVRLTDADLTLLRQNLTYTDTLNLDVAVNGVTFRPAIGANAQATATNLYNSLSSALAAGTIKNVSISPPSNGTIQITSVRAGVPFTVSQALVGGDDGLSIATETLVENSYDSGAVRGIENATAQSTGATTVYGGVALHSAAPIESDALLSVADQPQARPFTLTVGSAGFSDSSSFYDLGFQTGSFGGRSSQTLNPPDVSRFTFQIGTVDDEQLSIDLPNLARAGSATRDIVFGEPGGPEDPALSLIGRDQATEVLNLVDRALQELAEQRANLGGASSRLALRVTTLGEEQLNFSAARSAVEDLDYAMEASELAKTQIMKEATTAVMSQANTSMRKVLDLLRS
jgi:flagellin-like hook-associated protein FlgL